MGMRVKYFATKSATNESDSPDAPDSSDSPDSPAAPDDAQTAHSTSSKLCEFASNRGHALITHVRTLLGIFRIVLSS